MTDLLLRPSQHAGGAREATETATRSRRIVVAVDGSEASIEALRWTKAELFEPGDTVCAITAFAPPPATPGTPMSVEATHHDAECARTAAEMAIQEVFGAGEPGVVVDHVLALGNLESLAVRESTDAVMIVLGLQKRGWFRRRKSSTAKRITRHASCPVLSVPVGRRSAARRESAQIERAPIHRAGAALAMPAASA